MLPYNFGQKNSYNIWETLWVGSLWWITLSKQVFIEWQSLSGD
jgi:hypothetical protein